MITDSLSYNIPDREFADSLFSAVDIVGRNTDTMEGFSAWVTIISFTASFVTIIGLLMVFFEILNRWTSKRCQRMMILDLYRHFFINNAISEVIRKKMGKVRRGSILKDGILERYCVLDSDIDLGQISYSSKNYDMLHSLRVKLRNYNSVALNAEKHFTDPDYPIKMREDDLDDLLRRSIDLMKGFSDFAKTRRMNLNNDVVRGYIRSYYESKIVEWNKKSKIAVLTRKKGTNRAIYDDLYDLKDIEDALIRKRYSDVLFWNVKDSPIEQKSSSVVQSHYEN